MGLHAPTGLSKPVRHYACEMLDEAELARIVTEVAPDRIYHLAGSSKVHGSVGMPDYFNNNFLTTISLLRAVQKLQSVIALFFSSSVHVYGNQDNEVSENSDVKPAGFYGFSKYIAEEALKGHVAKMPKLRVVVGRLYSCIGPGQPEGFVASDLCKRIAQLPTHGPAILKTGPLSGYRRFLDVRDAVRIFPLLLSTKFDNRFEIFNIASPHELQVRRMVELLMDISGKRPKLETTDDNSNPFLGLKLSTNKLQGALPPLHFRPIEETLKDMLTWTERG